MAKNKSSKEVRVLLKLQRRLVTERTRLTALERQKRERSDAEVQLRRHQLEKELFPALKERRLEKIAEIITSADFDVLPEKTQAEATEQYLDAVLEEEKPDKPKPPERQVGKPPQRPFFETGSFGRYVVISGTVLILGFISVCCMAVEFSKPQYDPRPYPYGTTK